MTAPADLVLRDGEVHTLADPDETHEAVAVRDGDIVRVGSTYEVDFLVGVDTEVIDLDGRTVLPGFVDAHTHLRVVGRRQVNADLGGASGPEDCAARLRAAADAREEWILGFGYDESEWGGDYLTRETLDAVSTERPVAAFREDLHVASVNSVALGRLREDFPEDDVRTEDGDPTGVLVEDAAQVVFEAVDPGLEGTRDLLRAAQERALELGVTGVHEMIRNDNDPRVYREMALAGDLDLRVRLNYWSSYLDAVEKVGLRTNFGSDRLRVGGIKTFTDGSLGGRTAKLSEPYADGEGRGNWVVDPADLRALADRAAALDLQLCAHAIGDEAIDAALSTYEAVGDGEDARHRIEHAEILTDDLVERLAESDVVVSMQPNFLKWAREDGLYESRLGEGRTRDSNRFRDLLDAGARLAFGSDCMPLGPLFGVQQAVTAPAEGQRLTVTEALRAYTRGAALAGFDEDRLGSLEPGKRGDLVVLADSPWAVEPRDIADIDVSMTLIDGEIAHQGT